MVVLPCVNVVCGHGGGDQAHSEKIKEAGNAFFKAGNYRRALRRYEVGVRSCP